MSGPAPALSLVTLGVSDLARSVAFYEALGFRRKLRAADGVGFFEAGACALAVFPGASLAEDAAVPDSGSTHGFRGVALAWNCGSEAEVDAAIARARRAGATVPKPARKTFWGGYAGYFADPDGHLWEVAHNPGFALADDGRLTLPD
jgi:catechol 2,3-dioxygenase-like lactoylglutathione lyase family enzyme